MAVSPVKFFLGPNKDMWIKPSENISGIETLKSIFCDFLVKNHPSFPIPVSKAYSITFANNSQDLEAL